jgi:hypothetical protein
VFVECVDPTELTSNSPEAKVKSYIVSGAHVEEGEVLALFDLLKPVQPQFLLGEWTGGPVETGDPRCQWMKHIRFAGKRFSSVNNVEPVFVFNDNGEREFYEPTGHAKMG